MLYRFLAVCLPAALLILPGATRVSLADNDRVENLVVLDSALVSVFDDARLLASFGESRRAFSLTPEPRAVRAIRRDWVDFEVRLLTELGKYARADSLMSVSAPIDADDWFFHYLRRANLNLLADRPRRALENLAFTDSIPDGGYGAYRDYLRLRANLGMGRPREAVELGEKALHGGPPGSLLSDFEFALIEAYTQADRPKDAIDIVKALKRRVRRSDDVVALLGVEYDLFIQAGDLEAARQTASKLARVYRWSDEAERISLEVMSRVAPGKLGNDELLGYSAAMIAHGRYKGARALIDILDDRRLSNRQREERSIVKARYYYHTGNYRRAAALAKPRFQSPAYRRESVLILARSYRRSGKKREAANVYTYFAREYPNDAKAAEALYVAAKIYRSAGAKRSAQRVLTDLRKSYPSSYYGKMAVYIGARDYLRRGDFDRSVSILERAVRSSRRTDRAALYYLADTFGKMGRNRDKELLLKELRDLSLHSFYVDPVIESTFRRPHTTSTGEVALDGESGLLTFLTRVAERKEAARTIIRAELSGTVENPGLDEETQRCLDRGKRFLECGFREWGERELDHASRKCFNSPAALLEIGRVYDQYGMPWRSIRLYQRVKNSIPWKARAAYSELFYYLMYPVPYPAQVLEHAARYDLPPHLVYAMIREESRFDRNAVSRAGAVGLMQLMPETGRYVARELEIPNWGDEHLLDPEVNLAFGIWYASSLMEISDGDYLRMLAAYNAGPANAKRWFSRRDRASNIVDVVDGIDFKETRLYVQRIVESANVYHRLYFDDDSVTSKPGQ